MQLFRSRRLGPLFGLCALPLLGCGGAHGDDLASEDLAAAGSRSEATAGGEPAAGSLRPVGEPPRARGGTRAPRGPGVALLGARRAEDGEQPTAPRPPALEPPALPAARDPAGPYDAPTGLRAAEALHARALSLPLGSPSAAASVEAAVEQLVVQLEALDAALTELDRAYRDAVEADPSLRAAALTRRADAYDATAERVDRLPFLIPADIEAEIGEAEPEVREEIREVVRQRLHEILLVRARQLYCVASALYAHASRATPLGGRASAQRERYGAPFIASCPDLEP